MNLKNESIKVLSKCTQEILNTYKKAKFECLVNGSDDCSKKYYLRYLEDDVKLLSAKEYTLAIESIVDSLTEEEKTIIQKLYINKSDNPFWYLDSLSRSTFYRYKRRALEDFLYYF